MLQPSSSYFVLIKLDFSNGGIASHIGKEQISTRLFNLAILQQKLLQTDFACQTHAQLLGSSIT